MDLAWHPLGAFGFVVGVVTTALGVLVHSARSGSATNRLLAGYLVFFGAGSAAFNGLRLFATDRVDAYALVIAGWSTLLVSHAFYLLFMTTLDSPLVAWTRRYGIRWLLALPGAMAAIDIVVRPRAWVLDVEPLTGSHAWGTVSTPLRDLYLLGLTVLLVLSAAPAIHAWRRAPTGIERRRAAVLALAFVGTSLSFAAFLVWYLLLGADVNTPADIVANFLWQSLTSFAFVVGAAYGILKFQLFDIDLKIKWTIRNGTVAAAFVGIFFVVSEGAQTILSERLGSVAGLLAAGTLVFALAPLQRAADRLADRAMPRVRDDAEYRTVRKHEVYRAAVESALVDGSLSDKDRGVLATLAQELDLGAKDAHDIEREARAARAASEGP